MNRAGVVASPRLAGASQPTAPLVLGSLPIAHGSWLLSAIRCSLFASRCSRVAIRYSLSSGHNISNRRPRRLSVSLEV